jgi:tetratricopeptide (TPR) repeat protein
LIMRVPALSRILSLLLALTLVAPVARADDAAVARRHAQRASHLAASGKCKQAIAEFDKAIAVLRDPALLFNRAECHRKLGENDAALADYNQFLSDLPNAPNRATVQAHIAALGQSPAPMSALAAAPGAAAPAAAPKTAAPAPAVTAPVGSAGAMRLPTAPTHQAGDDLSPKSDSLLAGASPEPAPGSVGTEGSLFSRPWFWVAVGAVVVGAGLVTYVVYGHPSTVPATDLGNYRF